MSASDAQATVDELILEALARGRSVSMTARGGSMWPFIRDGDRLTLAPLDRAARVGDVVWVHVGSAPGPIHRVRRIDRDRRICVQGDASTVPDGWFSQTDLLGQVVAVERNGHRVRLHRRLPRVYGAVLRLVRPSQG